MVTTNTWKDERVGEGDALSVIQTISSELLAAAARGEVDLNLVAAEELANRGQDKNGKWIGFDKAAKIHNMPT